MSDRDVRAELRYLVRSADKPVYYASTAGADAALSIAAQFEEREVQVRDARACAEAPALDVEGFALVSHRPGIADFYALEAHREAYERELVDLVTNTVGASGAHVFDHTLRSDSSAVRGERTTREPASVIHNDYTDASAAKRLRDILPAEEAEERAQHRFAIINVWRTTGPTVWRSPLALCDARSLHADDLVASERRAAERVGELELVCWNPDHRWFYFPEMRGDESLLIKTFDSATDGVARRSIHSAFANPLAPPEAPPRESIESRLLVFFD